MRAISAGRIQSAQRALLSARRYEEVVLRGILAVANDPTDLQNIPSTAGPTLLLVMTSEQPFCGSFNQDVLELAEQRLIELRAQGETHLVVVGRRGAQQLHAHGLIPDAIEVAATSVPGLRDIVKRLAARVDSSFAAGKLGTLRAIYNRYESISEQLPTDEQILPLDLSKIRQTVAPPLARFDRYLSKPAMLAGLVGQYAFIRLYRMAADSFASEQASRLTAMDGATRNTEKMLESLTDLERRERQGEITREVLELIASRFASG